MSKPIQMAVTEMREGPTYQCSYSMSVLCDDGRIWTKFGNGPWEEVTGPWNGGSRDDRDE